MHKIKKLLVTHVRAYLARRESLESTNISINCKTEGVMIKHEA